MRVEPGLGSFATKLLDLSGQVAFVTGAGQGLGREMARALASAGAHVIIGGRNRAALDGTVATIAGEGGTAEALPFDIDDAQACADAISGIVVKHGRLDVLVNNAGIRDRTGFAKMTRDSMEAVLRTNLVAAADLAQRAAAAMTAGGRGGRIINIGSIAAITGQAVDPSYVASKAALAGITRAMAVEYGPYGITANDVSPGPFATEFNAAVAADPEMGGTVNARSALGRWGKPEELAGIVLLLASPGGAYITGQQIVVDGGYTIKGQ